MTQGRTIASGLQRTSAWPALGFRVVQDALLRRNVIRLSLLMCVASSTACVSTYVPSASEADTATLSFQVTGTPPLLGFGADLLKRGSPDDHACMMKTQRMARISQGMPVGKSNNPPAIVVPANVAIGLRALYTPITAFGVGGCSFDLTFVPYKGQAYQVNIDWTSASCQVELRVDVDGSWHTALANIERNWWC